VPERGKVDKPSPSCNGKFKRGRRGMRGFKVEFPKAQAAPVAN